MPEHTTALDDAALDQLFRHARSTHAFTSQPVTDETLHALFDLLKWGPTAFNSQPGRYVFVRSPEAKARLNEVLSRGNQAKTLAAPVTVIVAYDRRFLEHLPPDGPGAFLKDNAALLETTAFRNSTLQGAYLILAARALALGAGPMSGFDAAKLNTEFFPDSRWAANFLVNLGYPDLARADGSEPRPRASRHAFELAAQVL